MDADGFRPASLSSDMDIKIPPELATSKDASSSKQPPSSSSSSVPMPTPPIRLGEPSDAFSLQPASPSTARYTPSSVAGTGRYYDDDPAELRADDLPPLYSDTDNPADYSLSAGGPPVLPLGPPRRLDAPAPFKKDTRSGTEYYIDRRLDTDPEYLAGQLIYLAQFPPRPFVQLKGTHTETVRRDKNRTETQTVTDFDIQVELTPFLYGDISRPDSAWNELRTASSFEKVRRGTVFASRAPGFGGKSLGTAAANLEAANGDPSLLEWCHRYCASHAGLKSLLLQRRILGLDEETLKTQLETLVRATHYRGSLSITFPVRDSRVEIYNEAKTNRWRLTTWIQWLFMFTLLFIFAIPYLFFRTVRFEVVFADWHFSRPRADGRGKEYVSVGEAQWYNMWARAIQRAVLAKRQATLDHGDLRDAEAAEPGLGSIVEGSGSMENLLRAGMHAMSVVNRQFGWGGDC